MKKSEHPRAVAHELDGQVVLHDPDALALFKVAAKQNCQDTFNLNSGRIILYKERVKTYGLTADEAVIIIIDVDDPNGQFLANELMPNHNWQGYRDAGHVPFAGGICRKQMIQALLEPFDSAAAEKLARMTELAVVIVDFSVAEVYLA